MLRGASTKSCRQLLLAVVHACKAHKLLQVSYDDFTEFASLRKELHKLQVALEFYQKTTGKFTLDDLKVSV